MQPGPDEVSIIGSDDDTSSFVSNGREEVADSGTDNDDADAQLDLMLRFEDFMNDTGDLRDPVVNVWYDLDMITEVTDPLLFIKTRDQLRKIIDDAQIRLGINIDPAARQHDSPSEPSLSMQGKSERAASLTESSVSSSTSSALKQEPRPSRLERLMCTIKGISSKTGHRIRRLAMSPCHSTAATGDADSDI